ncbi:mannitol-1-phosphate 5-dehydrogenase [Gloeopeniophorella convolvens]|nr:mannitol-1-phosphate 5-dehydrogenase [Gloeopeniophorella convolvens]
MQERFANQPQAVHFGAGNIGRGFIGALLAESGYFVVFADVDANLIDEINNHDSYEVHILDQKERTEEIHSFAGALSQTDDVPRAIANPHTRLITTAVGPPILDKIAPTIARGLQARRAAGGGALNVIACENMVGQTEALGAAVRQHLSDAEREWAAEHVGFANCSVDRIVPAPPRADNPLDVGVEEFSEWAVDRSALRAPLDPPVRGITLTDSLGSYIERKLFTLNCGHATTAYLGFVHGYHTIDEAIADPALADVVRGALKEGGAALVKKHGFDEEKHAQYVERVLSRFANTKLHDDVVRVGRQPLRKLAKGDRLLGPTTMAHDYGLPVDNLTRGIAAAFLFDVKDDPQSIEIVEKIGKSGIDHAVAEYTGFEDGSEVHGKIVAAYRQLKAPKN